MATDHAHRLLTCYLALIYSLGLLTPADLAGYNSILKSLVIALDPKDSKSKISITFVGGKFRGRSKYLFFAIISETPQVVLKRFRAELTLV